MSELSFLLELLLEHKLPKVTKDAIKERIKTLQIPSTTTIHTSGYIAPVQRPPKTAQSPSTQKILEEMAAEGGAPVGGFPQGGGFPPVPMIEPSESVAPAQIAQTPAAMAALAQRNEAIRIATSGKEEKGRSSPRKF